MSTLIQLLLRSLETGAIYALATLGIIIVFRTNFMINFGQGVMGMFGAYIVTVLFNKMGLPIVLAILVGLIAAIGVGFLVDFIIIRRTKHVTGTGKEIITLGLMMVFLGITPMLFGVDPMRLPKVIENGAFSVGGANLSYNSLLNIVLGLAFTENKTGTGNTYDSIQRKDSQINGCAYKMGNIVCVGISACFRYIVRCNDCTINICYG